MSLRDIGGRGPDQKLYSVSSAKQPAGAEASSESPTLSICVSAPGLVTWTSVSRECSLECQIVKVFRDDVTLVLCPRDKMSAESDSGCAGPALLPGSVYSPSDLSCNFLS